jgi:glycosyltransferase involved in cell wall biosynthesis
MLAPHFPSKGVWGHAWEQFALPASLSRGDLLWSPANTGPMLRGNQVLSLYDVSPLEHPEWYPRSFAGYYRFLWPKLVKRILKIITASEFSRSRIMQLLNVPGEKIAVIPGGVADKFFPQTADTIAAVREKIRLPENYALFIGAFHPRKNLAALLRAWEMVCSHVQGIAL